MRARVRASSERNSPAWAMLAFALAAAVVLWIAASSLSRAQTAAPNAAPAQAPTLQAPSPQGGQTSPSLPSTGETLSERLDRSDGVIRPPRVGTVDPEIRTTAPDPNAGSNMPVIRPPGSPGGNPSVQPK